MPSAGSESAYRGYRLQALYTVFRILNSEDSHRLTFQPEGREDLAVFSDTGELVEAVQVKAYSENLTISTFSPQTPNSFFHRAVDLSRTNPDAAVKIVSFGPIGPEMALAWETDGEDRRSVTRKLSDCSFSPSDVDVIFGGVELVTVDSDSVREEVFTFLRDSLVGGEPKHAFELLSYWLYLASENRDKITYDSMIEKINSVGRYLAERATHHQEWLTSIVPLEDSEIPDDQREALAEEFYQGIAARYEHVLAGIDVLRHDRLAEIDAAFGETRTVIIHAASGQGKSTVAYRYLHDFFPHHWRFEVRLIEGRQHALNIARALAGHAKAVGAPMIIYVDVSPHDRNWPDLVRELAQYRGLLVLVTIREEDWRRATISGAGLQYREVELSFDEVEAQELYPRLVSRRRSDTYLTFDDAWRRFGASGPLLEFVHLITQNQSLHERLRQQVERLQDEVRVGNLHTNELELLRLVSIASAYEGRLDLHALVVSLGVRAPQRTLDLFEREYLLRQSQDGRFVEGLHPIRSAILVEHLTDPVFEPWSAKASSCLPMIVEEDLEVFLLHAFSRRGDEATELLEVLLEYQPGTWTGVAGILRSLLWLGVREYATSNRDLIAEAFDRFGPGWAWMLDFDVANVSPEFAVSWWQDLHAIPDEMKAVVEDLQARQSPKEDVFAYAAEWLAALSQTPVHPRTLSDWAGVAEVSFWTGHLEIDSSIPSWVTEADLEESLSTLPLDQLGDVFLGLTFAWGDRFFRWLDENRPVILNRFREETQTVVVDDDGELIRAHFILDLQRTERDLTSDAAGRDTGTSGFHDEALRRIELLRKLLPDRQEYGCQGYGHRLGALTLPFDETEKPGVPVEALPPFWPVRVNALFRHLAIRPLRPGRWNQYAQTVDGLREMVLDSLQELQGALIVHFRKQKPVRLLGEYIDAETWDRRRLTANSPPLLPQCAVDEWGFVGEGMAQRKGDDTKGQLLRQTEEAVALWQHKEYLSALRDVTSSLANFYWQGIHVLVTNTLLAKAKLSEAQEQSIRAKLVAQGVKTDLGHLSTYNFAEALKNLRRFQEEFTRRFAQFFDEGSLGRLDARETDAFMHAWSLWYQFAFHPSRVWQDPDGEALRKLNNCVAHVRRNIRRGLRRLSEEGIQAAILSEDIRWEGKLALWIVFDVTNPVTLHAAFASVVSTLKAAVDTVGNNKLQRYALEFSWPTIAFVPLLGERCLSKTAWRIATPVFLSRTVFGQDDWWNYAQHTVPAEVWEKLGLPVWQHPGLELANEFQSAVATLSLFVAHLQDLDGLPEADEQGARLLQAHVTEQANNISETLQRILDLGAEMGDHFNRLTLAEREERPALMAGMTMLLEMRGNLMPSEDFEDSLEMDLDSIEEWMHRLASAVVQAEVLRLCWAADALGLPVED